MKRSLTLGLMVLATAVILPLAKGTPVLARFQEMTAEIAQQVLRPQVKLVLQADQQVHTVDEQGKAQLAWQPLAGEVTVLPQDILRYTILSANEGEGPASDLVITQPIPPEMTYELKTATGNDGVAITYSIDGGETFVAAPLVEVVQEDGTVTLEPAPAEAYTHIRWDFADALQPEVTVQVSYVVQVK
jgi:uncharacterized repeat protein (TIGR01451 family)